MNSSWYFFMEGVLPWGLLAAVGGGCLVLYALGLRRCVAGKCRFGVLLLLRAVSLLLLGWCAVLPSCHRVTTVTEKPVIAVAVDNSDSMRENPAGEKMNRGERAKAFLQEEHWREFSQKGRVKLFSIGEEARPLASEEELHFREPDSRLSAGLAKIGQQLHGEHVAALFLLSDGQDQTLQRTDSLAAGLPPVYAVELEESQTLPKKTEEWTLGAVSCPRRLAVHWKSRIVVPVFRTGGGDAGAFSIRLLRNGVPFQEKNGVFAEGATFSQVEFPLEEAMPGTVVYRVELTGEKVPAPTEERQAAYREFLVEVTDAQRRILYLEGVPLWDFKYLRRALQADRHLQVSAFARGPDGGFLSFDEAGRAVLPPWNAEALRPCKAIILGNFRREELGEAALAALRKYVEQGGALVLLGGAQSLGEQGIGRSNPLAEILPVEPLPEAELQAGLYPVQISAEGRALPAFAPLVAVAHCPPVLSLWRGMRCRPAAVTLMTAGQNEPLLVTGRAGQGQVAVVLTDTLWKWKLAEAGNRTADDQEFYRKFLTQLLQWLAPEQGEGAGGEAVALLLRERETEAYRMVEVGALPPGKVSECRVVSPSGQEKRIPMRRALLGKNVGASEETAGMSCQFMPEEEGTYRVTVLGGANGEQAEALLLVKAPSRERTGALMDRRWLREMAERTGGKWIPWKERRLFLQNIPCETVRREGHSQHSLWTSPFLLIFLLIFLSLEWALRRRWNIV